jgi:hypothetical protein
MNKYNRLTRAQAIKVKETPRKKGVVKELAIKYNVSEALIKHVRHKCKVNGYPCHSDAYHDYWF